MPEYGFSLTCVFPYQDKIKDFYGSKKTRILAYFTHIPNFYVDLLNLMRVAEYQSFIRRYGMAYKFHGFVN